MVVNGRVLAYSKRISGNIGNNGAVNGDIQKAENIYVKETEFNNRYEFPSIGKDNIIYVAKDENKTYRFNEDSLTYYCIGSDYNEIEVIQGIL